MQSRLTLKKQFIQKWKLSRYNHDMKSSRSVVLTHWDRWARAAWLSPSSLSAGFWRRSSSTCRLTEGPCRCSEAAAFPWCSWSVWAPFPRAAPSWSWPVCRSSVAGCLVRGRAGIWWGAWGSGTTARPADRAAEPDRSHSCDTCCCPRSASCTSHTLTGRWAAGEAANERHLRDQSIQQADTKKLLRDCCYGCTINLNSVYNPNGRNYTLLLKVNCVTNSIVIKCYRAVGVSWSTDLVLQV